MTSAQDSHALVSYYAKQYKEKYGKAPIINRFSAKWVFEAILSHMSVDEAKELVDYYFTTASGNGHNFRWFSYNYELLMQSKDELDSDRAQLDKIREETRIRTEEWRKKFDNNRVETD